MSKENPVALLISEEISAGTLKAAMQFMFMTKEYMSLLIHRIDLANKPDIKKLILSSVEGDMNAWNFFRADARTDLESMAKCAKSEGANLIVFKFDSEDEIEGEDVFKRHDVKPLVVELKLEKILELLAYSEKEASESGAELVTTLALNRTWENLDAILGNPKYDKVPVPIRNILDTICSERENG